MHNRVDQFKETANREMKNELSRGFLLMLSLGAPIMRQIGMSSFPDPAAAEAYGRAIRAEVMERLPELLEEFEKNAEAAGAKIIWTKDAAGANAAVLEIAKERNISYVTKGKSMVTEEIGLNEYLIENGVNVFETDLGEVITQMLGRPPFHIVGPALNVSPQEISDTFLKKGIIKEPTVNPVELGRAARVFLREKFRHLQLGIVGINMAVAETGTIINVENEGNIRMNKSSPKTLVAIMSIEKVVPTMADALHMARILSRNCTGQKLTGYVSMDTGPKKPGEIDGPEELFIVIVDNGRSEIYRDVKVREILKCIRCGACLNTCPVYSKIGGYPYGFSYSGPMGQIINPMLLGIGNTADLYRACTLCGACKNICPAGIDHPSLLLEYRARQAGQGNMPIMEGMAATIASGFMASGALWSIAAKCARPLINSFAKEGYIKNLPFMAKGWFTCRDLKAMPQKTFREMWKELEKTDAGRKESV